MLRGALLSLLVMSIAILAGVPTAQADYVDDCPQPIIEEVLDLLTEPRPNGLPDRPDTGRGDCTPTAGSLEACLCSIPMGLGCGLSPVED